MPTIEPLGDGALLLRWRDAVDAADNRRVHAAAARLRAAAPPWLLDVVPAYASLAVFFDPSTLGTTDPAAWLQACAVPAGAAGARDGAPAARRVDDASAAVRCVELPVCYGGEFGPDLDDVAAAAGLDRDEAIARHARPDYLVAMLGFSPGFPYLLGLDPALAAPRLATPRPRVPAGSVGIGGAQTGVYPDAGPGGWRLVGRTPLRLFDARRSPPALVQPGDRVRFVPIGAAEFRALCDGGDG